MTQSPRSSTSLPLCLGVDPSPQVLAAWGCADTPSGIARFAENLMDCLEGQMSIIKPQIAYFERFGSQGVITAELLCRLARRRGISVILDAKRGDIPETNTAYASAYLKPGASFEVDGLTLSPYLGVSSLEPFIRMADATGKSLYLVLKSSNPEGRELQNRLDMNQQPMWQHVLELVEDWPNCLGVVVGASDPDLGYIVKRIPQRPLLIPGVGAQGGSLATIHQTLLGSAAVINMSRALLLGGPGELNSRIAAAQRTLHAHTSTTL